MHGELDRNRVPLEKLVHCILKQNSYLTQVVVGPRPDSQGEQPK